MGAQCPLLPSLKEIYMAEHSTLPEAQLHNPKGFSTAASSTILWKNGSGTLSWSTPTSILATGITDTRKALISDGSGGAAWQYPMIHGGVYYPSVPTPVTITGSGAADVLISNHDITTGVAGTPFITTTSTVGSHSEFTMGTDGTITYTGSLTRHFHIAITVSCSTSAPTSKTDTVKCIMYHQDSSAGVAWLPIIHSDIRMTASKDLRSSTAIHADIMMNAGDKITIALQNITDVHDIKINTFYMFAMGMVGV
jgi:hypothetical protein